MRNILILAAAATSGAYYFASEASFAEGVSIPMVDVHHVDTASDVNGNGNPQPAANEVSGHLSQTLQNFLEQTQKTPPKGEEKRTAGSKGAQSQTGGAQNVPDRGAEEQKKQPSKAQAVTIPNSTDNYLDDKLSWGDYISARAQSNDDLPSYCLPPGTRLIGLEAQMTSVAVQQAENESGQANANVKQYLKARLDPTTGFFGSNGPQGPVAAVSTDKAKRNCPDMKTGDKVAVPQNLATDESIYITADDAKAAFREGLEYGALVVPFKARFSGKEAFSGSATVGPYVGYRFPVKYWGLEISPVIFVGGSNISTTDTVSSKSETLAGLSYGGGFLFDIKSNFHAGFVVGFDHTGSSTYQYNDKPWFSFEIGYSFAR